MHGDFQNFFIFNTMGEGVKNKRLVKPALRMIFGGIIMLTDFLLFDKIHNETMFIVSICFMIIGFIIYGIGAIQYKNRRSGVQ